MEIIQNVYQSFFNRIFGVGKVSIYTVIITIVVLVAIAFAAGDGLIGEIQFMIAGFFSFFWCCGYSSPGYPDQD